MSCVQVVQEQGRIDILVNNAGCGTTCMLMEHDLEDAKKVRSQRNARRGCRKGACQLTGRVTWLSQLQSRHCRLLMLVT